MLSAPQGTGDAFVDRVEKLSEDSDLVGIVVIVEAH
jgi:hypothetical protein